MKQGFVVVLVLGTFVASVRCGWAVEPDADQAKAVAEIQKLGGTVTINAKNSDKPVTGIDFSRSKVTDAGLDHLKGMTHLESLFLGETRIGDSGLARLKHLTQLKALYLFHTQVTDKGMSDLRWIVNLRILNLDGCSVGNSGLEHLSGMSQLEWLSLNKTQVSDDGLVHLAKLKALALLGLAETRVTDRGMQHLADVTTLRQLVLNRTEISDAGLAHLSGLVNLEQLYLSGTRITDVGLLRFTSLTNLRQLYMTNTKVTYDGALGLQDALPMCTMTCPPTTSVDKARDTRPRVSANLAAKLTFERANSDVAVRIGKVNEILRPVLPPVATSFRFQSPSLFPGLKNLSWGITSSGPGTSSGTTWSPIHCFTITEKTTGKAMKWYVQGASTDDYFMTRSAIGWDGDYILGVFVQASNCGGGAQIRTSSARKTETVGYGLGQRTARIQVRFLGESDIRFVFVSYDAKGNQLPANVGEDPLVK